MSKNMKVIELIDFDAKLNRYISLLEEVKHLGDLSEETLCQNYQSCFHLSSLDNSSDLSEENMDIYYRLKFRSIDERINKVLPIVASMEN